MSHRLQKVSDNTRRKRGDDTSSKQQKPQPQRRHSDFTPPSFSQDQDLHRRVSSFVGHNAYEESKMKETVDRPVPTTSQTHNFATNYLAGKRNLTEGRHDRIYKWMGLASEADMRASTKDEDKNDDISLKIGSARSRTHIQRRNTVIGQVKPTIKVRSLHKTEK